MRFVPDRADIWETGLHPSQNLELWKKNNLFKNFVKEDSEKPLHDSDYLFFFWRQRTSKLHLSSCEHFFFRSFLNFHCSRISCSHAPTSNFWIWSLKKRGKKRKNCHDGSNFSPLLLDLCCFPQLDASTAATQLFTSVQTGKHVFIHA